MTKQQDDAAAKELADLKKQQQAAKDAGNTAEVARLQALIDQANNK